MMIRRIAWGNTVDDIQANNGVPSTYIDDGNMQVRITLTF